MPMVKVRRDGQIILPTKIRKAYSILAGDVVEVEPHTENSIIIKLKEVVDRRVKMSKEINKELARLNRINPVKEVSEEELEAMTEEPKRRVFERHYGKI